MKMEKLFFKPWIGENYESGGLFGKKILVIGESHYCDGCDKCGGDPRNDECSDFTKNVVLSVINGESSRWSGTFRKFERSLVGHDTTHEQSVEIWQSLAFYNYLQVAVSGPREAGDWYDYEKSEAAFYDVLESLQPDVIIVWGVTRMWDNMPSKGWEKGDEIKIDSYSVKNGWYTLANGHRIRAIWVYHPSTSYSWEWWNKVIKSQLVK